MRIAAASNVDRYERKPGGGKKRRGFVGALRHIRGEREYRRRRRLNLGRQVGDRAQFSTVARGNTPTPLHTEQLRPFDADGFAHNGLHGGVSSFGFAARTASFGKLCAGACSTHSGPRPFSRGPGDVLIV